MSSMSMAPEPLIGGCFIAYAKHYPNLTFQVTRIGCGLAGWTNEQVAPLFVNAPANCQFDTEWKPFLGEDRTYWGIGAGFVENVVFDNNLASRTQIRKELGDKTLVHFVVLSMNDVGKKCHVIISWNGVGAVISWNKADALFQQVTNVSTSSEAYYNYATFLVSQDRKAEAREWAQRILAKKPTMPNYLQRRERPWFRKAKALLKRLPA